MTFDQYLQQARHGDSFAINRSWQQGRTIFGGLTAALVLAYLDTQCKEAADLRSLAVSFCGKVAADVPVTIRHAMLSQGKSITQVNGQLLQQGNVVTQVTACYAHERESDLLFEAANMDLPEPGSGQKVPFIEGLAPDFIQHMTMDLHQGQFPFTNSREKELAGWMKLREAGGQMTNAHLLGLLDAWPPVVLQNLKRPAPAATVTWQVELVRPLAQFEENLPADSWVYFHDKTVQAQSGYTHTEAQAFNQQGQLLALSRQLVSVYG